MAFISYIIIGTLESTKPKELQLNFKILGRYEYTNKYDIIMNVNIIINIKKVKYQAIKYR